MGVLNRVVADTPCDAVPGERYAMSSISRTAARTKVLIVGGGFAGIETARRLGRQLT